MKYTAAMLTALCAALDPPLAREGVMVLCVDDDEIAVKRIDAAEWELLKEASKDNPDWQQLALQRAVLGIAGVDGLAPAQALLASWIADDPQLGDLLGSQLAAAAGQRAKVQAVLGAGRSVALRVQIDLPGAPSWEIAATRPGEGQWRDVRRAIQKGGEDAGALRCWELCVPTPPDVALYPALPVVCGYALMTAMKRRVGDPSL